MAQSAEVVVPPGAVATVKIIDTTSKIGKIPVEFLMTPPIQGFDFMPELPSWAFLVESPTGKKAIFDLGIPKDWKRMAPVIVELLENRGWLVEAQKNTSEILEEHGYSLESIGSVIWSHWHWDHLGDPATFPPSTELVVGPGFKANLMPGFPLKEDAPVRESDFAGREVREVVFAGDNYLRIGDIDAIDFFGDGSFYVLNTPGHTIGHLCGLARTTANTFILMGGDLCHHAGEMRPSEYLPLPDAISPHPWTKALQPPCPGSLFAPLQTKRDRGLREPFFDPGMGHDIPEAIRSIKKVQKADARDNFLFIYAHDTKVREVADLFPLSANNWQEKGWREQMLWGFLEDFKSLVDYVP